MLKRIKTRFIELSRAGRIGAVGAAILCLFIVGSAVNAQSSSRKESCKASTTETTETQSIPFDKTQVNDANLEQGKNVLTTAGIDGEKTLTNKVTDYSPKDCKPSTTTFVKEEVTKQPVAEVTSIGTKALPPPTPAPTPSASARSAGNCNPNYSPCIANAYDLDCGDIRMRVSVIGSDPYRLDADNDGIGCESY